MLVQHQAPTQGVHAPAVPAPKTPVWGGEAGGTEQGREEPARIGWDLAMPSIAGSYPWRYPLSSYPITIGKIVRQFWMGLYVSHYF